MVRFTKEQINIRLYPDYILVEGYYVYKNPFLFPAAQGLSVPLPVDERHPAPVMVDVEQRSPEEKTVMTRYILGRYHFDLTFAPKEEIVLRVRYRQQAPDQDARYILRTTKPWMRPLQHGNYRIFLNGVKDVSSNYALTADGPGTLSFKRQDFMPQEDWQFSWEEL